MRIPQRRYVVALALGVLTAGAAAAQLRPADPRAQLDGSTDVAWLERIASSPSLAREVPNGARLGGAKAVRVAAFARLGAIGSTESLAAIARIERAMASMPLTPDTVPLDVWPTVAWHMSDEEIDERSRATAPARDGVTYAVLAGTLLGGHDLFLVSTRKPADVASWSRPKLVGPLPAAVDVGQATLTWRGARTLVFNAAARTLQISLEDVERDSDGDGWTDLEEARIGTNPYSADSDDDGIADGRDVCPLYAAPSGGDDAAQILQAAVFAAFAMTGSRQMLYVTPQTPRVHLSGYGGPVIFDRTIPKGGESGGAAFVSWKIASRSDTDALVEVTDLEGMLAAGGQDVMLKRLAGRWVVVAVRSTWVS